MVEKEAAMEAVMEVAVRVVTGEVATDEAKAKEAS